MTEKSPLPSPPSATGKEETLNTEEFRAREQERRASKKVKKQEKKERQGNKREERGEKARARFQKGVPEEGLASPPQAAAPPSAKEESHRQWEIEALEGAQEDLEKEKREREEETAKLVKEAEEREKREKMEPREEKDEKKEKWPSTVARVVDKAFNKFEEAKYGEDRLRLNRLRNLQTDVEGMINTYQSAAQQGWPLLPNEESRLLRLKRDIENQLESMAKEGTSAPPAIKEPPPPPSGGEKEPQPSIEAEPIGGKTREERIAAFRARREELERKNKEESWDSDEDFQKFGMESADRETAGNYNFDSKKIDEAIEEAKKEKNLRYREQSIERLTRAKALIEKEIGIASAESFAEKKEDGKIEDMKGIEGAPAPQKEEPIKKSVLTEEELKFVLGEKKEETAKEKETKFEFAGDSRPSAKHPERNEDSFFLFERQGAFGVFDGMGGGPSGEVASSLTRDIISKELETISADALVEEVEKALSDALQKAHERIIQEGIADASKKGMGTTASLVKIIEREGTRTAVIANVGDSRVYKLTADGKLVMLTLDDGIAGTMELQEKFSNIVDPNEFSGEEYKLYAQRNLISQVVGIGAITPRLQRVALGKGEKLFLTSDGAHDNLTNKEIEKLLNEKGTQQEIVQKIINAAYNRSGDNEHLRHKPDDITAILIGEAVGAKEAESTPQGVSAGQAQQEAQPQAGALAAEPTQQEQRPVATAEGAAQESPEMGRAINELLGEELGGNAQMREAAEAVVGARREMREALATRKEERLYAEAGAGFIAPKRLQEATQLENAYENALVGLSARLRESAGNNAEAFLVPYLNIQNAEAMRIAQMREAALTPERRSIAVRFYQRLNNPFNSDVPPRWARYVRVGLTAAVLGGTTAALGGAGALGIAGFAGWRMGKSFAYMAANGIARSGIDMALTRRADTMMGEERGRQRATMQEALRNNERIEALQESLRASIRGFQSEAVAQLENRKFYGRAATFGLMGLSGLISYELARPSAVAADEGAFGGHIATNEDVLRQRFYGAWDRVFGGKPSAEVIEDIIGKPSVGETAPPSGGSAIAPESEKGFGTPEEEAAALKRARGELPPHQGIESVRERMMEETARIPKTGIEKETELARPLAPETSMIYPSSEDIAKGKEAIERIGEAPIATIGKGGNIWEASRSLIGEGEGKISKEQWLEAWEKSDLADKGFVKPGAAVRFDAAEGLLKVSEAKDNEFLYQALVAEGKIKAGEPVPPEYQWLEKARGIEHHTPSPGEQAEHITKVAEARPAITKETFEEIMRERATGGATLKEFFDNYDAYMKEFGGASLADQEAKIADIERGFEHLRRANELEIKLRPEIREELLGLQKQSGILLEDLQKHPAYLEHVKAWEALEKEWGRKVGVSEAQFAELNNKWSVERFLDTAKKIENRDFVPSDPLSKVLEARRMGTLEMAEKIRSHLPDRGAFKMPLGRFLKNTL